MKCITIIELIFSNHGDIKAPACLKSTPGDAFPRTSSSSPAQLGNGSLRRLYREWAELHTHLLEERPMPPTPEERHLLRERGSAALQALLGAVSDQLLLYIAPDSLPGQVWALHEPVTSVFSLAWR